MQKEIRETHSQIQVLGGGVLLQCANPLREGKQLRQIGTRKNDNTRTQLNELWEFWALLDYARLHYHLVVLMQQLHNTVKHMHRIEEDESIGSKSIQALIQMLRPMVHSIGMHFGILKKGTLGGVFCAHKEWDKAFNKKDVNRIQKTKRTNQSSSRYPDVTNRAVVFVGHQIQGYQCSVSVALIQHKHYATKREKQDTKGEHMVTMVNRTTWIMKLTIFARTAMKRRQFKEIGNNSVLMLFFWPNLQVVILVIYTHSNGGQAEKCMGMTMDITEDSCRQLEFSYRKLKQQHTTISRKALGFLAYT